jgi:hypothetical protein
MPRREVKCVCIAWSLHFAAVIWYHLTYIFSLLLLLSQLLALIRQILLLLHLQLLLILPLLLHLQEISKLQSLPVVWLLTWLCDSVFDA